MTQSGKSEEEVIKLIKEAKQKKEASKSWADYDPNEPFDPSDIPEFADFLPKRIKNKPPKIDTDVGKIVNPILHDKNELYNTLIQHLEIHHPDYHSGHNLDKALEHTLSYLQELNNNTKLPPAFIKSIERFIYQFKPSETTQLPPTTDDNISLPDVHDHTPTVSEDVLIQHIKDIIHEHRDILDILTTRHIIKLLEGKLHTNLTDYKSFIKQTIKENIPQAPSPKQPTPKPSPKINMEELFGTPSPQPEEIEIEPPKPKKSPKSPKAKKAKKSKSVKRKSVKKSKRKSVKKSKSVKRKSVKKSKSVKRKSVKKSKKAKKSKKSKSVKRKSVKKSKKSKKSKSVKRKSVKKSKKSKSVNVSLLKNPRRPKRVNQSNVSLLKNPRRPKRVNPKNQTKLSFGPEGPIFFLILLF
ncbi:MAG: terminal domain [Bacteroidota bacterium]